MYLLKTKKSLECSGIIFFWDNTPFCTLLFIDTEHRKNGYGKLMMEYWEKDMKSQGYEMLMTSTQVDEDAQHFYRKLG
ncbi:GNAT family N-acetyltransferase [Bacteroides heparinolyticus]|uniref:GNAT family N-acetyltransferase n=1 Tax=Prevotella heparinolytica TaxID=28113 RepID=UPI00359F6810